MFRCILVYFREFRKNYNFRETRKLRKFDLAKNSRNSRKFRETRRIFASFVFRENPEKSFVKNPNGRGSLAIAQFLMAPKSYSIVTFYKDDFASISCATRRVLQMSIHRYIQ